MIKTFIYGTPHGFNFYEKDDVYDNYFKGFYISSRRNRRLMINRQANGVTAYNYLQYNLIEAEGRPHAFFGMSIIMDEYRFCPNFQEILKWFDWLFAKLVDDKKIFSRIDDGSGKSYLKYRMSRFEERSSDIEWLKSVLPNIFSTQAKTTILPIDASFMSGKTGQVIGLNDSEDDAIILEALKTYPWVTLSSDYEHLENNQIASASIDLDYGDLCHKRDEFNAVLLPIAIDVSKAELKDLEGMKSSVEESLQNILAYSKVLKESEEISRFSDLQIAYEQLENSIAALIKKKKEIQTGREGEDSKRDEQTQYCYSCKQVKSTKEFRDASATKCLDCESKEKKTCKQCGKQKSVIDFSLDSDICKECESQLKNAKKRCAKCNRDLPLSAFNEGENLCRECRRSKEFSIKKHTPMLVGIALAVLAVVGILYYLNSHHMSDPRKANRNQEQAHTEGNVQGISQSSATCDPSKIEQLLSGGDIEEIYNYISDKSDKEDYYSVLHKIVEDKFWSIINSLAGEYNYNIAQQSILEEKITIQSVINEIGYEFDVSYWTDIAKDYGTVWDYARKPSLTSEEKNAALKIINKYPGKFDSFRDRINLISTTRQESPITQQDITDTKDKELRVRITQFNKDGKTVKSEKELVYPKDSKVGIVGLQWEFVIIENISNNDDSKPSFTTSIFKEARDGKKIRIQLTETGSVVYRVGKMEITVTSKKFLTT